MLIRMSAGQGHITHVVSYGRKTMTLSLTNNEHQLVLRRAQGIEAFLDDVGIKRESYYIGSVYIDDPSYISKAYISGATSVFTVRTKQDVPYLKDYTRDLELVAIPFFLKDFNLQLNDMLETSVALSTVIESLQKLRIDNLDVEYPGSPKTTEGYLIRPQGTLFQVMYTERGQEELIFETSFPWVVAMTIAWKKNYRNVDWSRFVRT